MGQPSETKSDRAKRAHHMPVVAVVSTKTDRSSAGVEHAISLEAVSCFMCHADVAIHNDRME